jgi:hypothetical protein
LSGITQNVREGSAEISFRINLVGLAKEIADPNVLSAILEDALDLAENQARSLAPYDTGELAGSIGHEVRGVFGKLFATADHAAPVEFGHVTRGGTFVAPRPYLREGAEDGFAYLEKRVQRHIEQVMAKQR